MSTQNERRIFAFRVGTARRADRRIGIRHGRTWWQFTSSAKMAPPGTPLTQDDDVMSYAAPQLCQFEEEELMLAIGELVYPTFLRRWPGENGLRLWVEGTGPSDASRDIARFQFTVLLGALRSWRLGAGELQVERLDGLGPAAARDEAGNQWLAVGTAVTYDLIGEPHLVFGRDVATAVADSMNLANALWLNGRASRSAADSYMIHEYAEREFDGTDGITLQLGLSGRSQNLLTRSANNLSPRFGGRHTDPSGSAPWSLMEQQTYVLDLLQRWVFRLAHGEHPPTRPYRRRRA